MPTNKSILELKREVKKHYRVLGRHDLPWRAVQTPYTVFVSEVMLQQTQVHRVLPKYTAFMKRFPTLPSLSSASLSSVYSYWQGLGYNRRAKYLRDAAKIIVKEYRGVMPKEKRLLESLPGIGPYTAGAILAFAYGNPGPFVETNLRTAVLYHVFRGKDKVRDEEVLSVLKQLRPRAGSESRNWYAALMDYGAHLKRSGVRLNQKSAHHTKQSKFEGSLRQVRGATLRELRSAKKTEIALFETLPYSKKKIRQALLQLNNEDLIRGTGGKWSLAL